MDMSKFKNVSDLESSLKTSKKRVEKQIEIEFLRQQISQLQRNGHLHDNKIAFLLQMMQMELNRQQTDCPDGATSEHTCLKDFADAADINKLLFSGNDSASTAALQAALSQLTNPDVLTCPNGEIIELTEEDLLAEALVQ
jgi:hypothetical protein